MSSLADALAAAAKLDSAPAEWQDALRSGLTLAESQYPELKTSPQGFVKHLGQLLAKHGGPQDGLSSLHFPELVLSFAAASGDANAHRVLEEKYFPRLLPAVRSFHKLGEDEILQRLRDKLLTPPAKIADYAGRGELGAWLKVTAVRLAISASRGKQREVFVGQDALERATDLDTDPEVAHLKSRYKGEFEQAFRNALHSLTPRQRNLLRLQLVDGLTADDLAGLFEVHRATAARWVQSARLELAEKTKDGMMTSLGLASGEVHSIMRLVRSQIDITLSTKLGDTSD